MRRTGCFRHRDANGIEAIAVRSHRRVGSWRGCGQVGGCWFWRSWHRQTFSWWRGATEGVGRSRLFVIIGGFQKEVDVRDLKRWRGICIGRKDGEGFRIWTKNEVIRM